MGMEYPFESREFEIKESIESILKSEAQIAECLSCLFCNISEELKDVYPVEKRILLSKQIVNAYACKEKAMADLIKSLSCLCIASKKPSKARSDINRILFILIFLLVLKRLFSCCNC